MSQLLHTARLIRKERGSPVRRFRMRRHMLHPLRIIAWEIKERGRITFFYAWKFVFTDRKCYFALFLSEVTIGGLKRNVYSPLGVLHFYELFIGAAGFFLCTFFGSGNVFDDFYRIRRSNFKSHRLRDKKCETFFKSKLE